MSDVISIIGNGYSALFQAAVLSLAAGALLPLAFSERKKGTAIASFVPAIVGALLTIVLSASIAISGSELMLSPPFSVPLPSLAIQFHVDGMASFFMLIIGVVTIAISVYSLGYVGEFFGKHSLKALGFLFNLFVMSMLLVVASDNVFTFLVFWEAMSLASFFLVIYEHTSENSIKAGMTYIIMTHLGTAFILGSFLVLYFQTGSLSFDTFRSSQTQIPLLIKDIIFVLALIGFGTKAGLVPMHLWLPQAHPSAPSNISALMSAVMIKTAIYGLVRVTLDFTAPSSPDSAWWGMLMVVTGSASALIGVLYAAIEKDIKRALAYSSIENIGIVVLGFGLSVIFISFGLKALAAFALLASMYHSLNHAAFKSLLFMGAGSILFGAHTKNMEQLGGLVKRMPYTTLLFLIGAIAISALPPLNGFVSEWMTMQTLLSSHEVPNVMLQISISFASIVFALTAGIALATFVKIFGISFLSRPRSEHAENAKEVPMSMVSGMAMAAAACIVLGVVPSIGAGAVASAFDIDTSQLTLAISPFESITSPQNVQNLVPGSMSMPAIAVIMGSVAAAIVGFFIVTGSSRKTARRIYGTWDCGFGELDRRMQYTGTSLSQPIRTVFKALYKPHLSVQTDYYSDSNQYLKKSIKVHSDTTNIFEDRLYSPVTRVTIGVFDKMRRIQTGKINAYLLYVMIALVILLILARWMS